MHQTTCSINSNSFIFPSLSALEGYGIIMPNVPSIIFIFFEHDSVGFINFINEFLGRDYAK